MDFFSKRIHQHAFSTEAKLIAYLNGMARHKILELERRHYDVQKRNIRCQVPLDLARKSREPVLIDSRQQSEELLFFMDRLDRMLQPLEARSRLAVRLLLDGYTRSEIIELLGMSERFLYHVLEGIGECLVNA